MRFKIGSRRTVRSSTPYTVTLNWRWLARLIIIPATNEQRSHAGPRVPECIVKAAFMKTTVFLGETIFPTDTQLLGLAAFVLLIVASNVALFVGLKMSLGPRKRFGSWLASISAIVLASIVLFIVMR